MRRRIANVICATALTSSLLGISAVANAAEMPVKAPAAQQPAPPPFSWTGFYIGAEFGWGESRTESIRNVGNTTFPVGFTQTIEHNGVLAGGEVGANYQINQFVIGVEGDWQGAGISGTNNVASPLVAGRFTEEAREVNWVATVTGRAGVAWDRWLLYAKGGAAWRRVNQSASNTTISGAGVTLASESVFADTQSGYVVGGGLEWAFSEQVSVKVEGDWYNFGSAGSTGGICNFGGCGGAGAIVAAGEVTDTTREMWEIKGGVNIHFNFPYGGAVAARY